MDGVDFANLLWELERMISKSRQILWRPDKAAIERQWIDIWINWKKPLAHYTHLDAGT